MINNPLFRKFKENSLWWVLIAVFLLMLVVVTVDTGIGITPTVKVIAYEEEYRVESENINGVDYIFIFDRNDKFIDVFRVTPELITDKERQYLKDEYKIDIDNLIPTNPPSIRLPATPTPKTESGPQLSFEEFLKDLPKWNKLVD